MTQETKSAEALRITKEELDRWLEAFNVRVSDAGIPHRQRPFLAISAFSKERNCAIRFRSSFSDYVFRWFEEHSPAGAHAIGSLFEGSFYYDSYFWPVTIQHAYGTVRLNAIDSLQTMPEVIRHRLLADQQAMLDYMALWADCLDYGFGFEEGLHSDRVAHFARHLYISGDKELRATVALLHQARPSSKAVESSRMATEIFLKCFLALHGSLSEDDARKKIAHNLAEALGRCMQVAPANQVASLAPRIGAFPEVGARYTANEYTFSDIWHMYGTAQFAATTVVRLVSSRDARRMIEENWANVAAANKATGDR